MSIGKTHILEETSFINNLRIPVYNQWHLSRKASTPFLTKAVSKKSSVTSVRDVSDAASAMVRNLVVFSNQETMYTREKTLLEHSITTLNEVP